MYPSQRRPLHRLSSNLTPRLLRRKRGADIHGYPCVSDTSDLGSLVVRGKPTWSYVTAAEDYERYLGDVFRLVYALRQRVLLDQFAAPRQKATICVVSTKNRSYSSLGSYHACGSSPLRTDTQRNLAAANHAGHTPTPGFGTVLREYHHRIEVPT